MAEVGPDTSMLEAALIYCRLGWHVIPMNRKDKIPHVKWKEFQTVKPDEEKITTWWKKWPDANVAVITGAGSGFFTLDFDAPEAVEWWRSRFGDVPDAVWFATSRGKQCLLKHVKGVGLKVKFSPETDLKGEGGYCVVPPSVHASGAVYAWGNVNPLIDPEGAMEEIPDCPPDMLKYILSAPNLGYADGKNGRGDGEPPKKDKDWFEKALFTSYKEGARNVETTMVAGRIVHDLAAQGKTKEEIRPLLLQGTANFNARNDPPLPLKDIETICTSVLERHSFATLNDTIGGKGIFEIQIVTRIAADPIYKIYPAECKQPIVCTIDELTSITKFRNRYAIATNHIIPPIKMDVWCQVLNGCLAEATVKEEELDQSPVASLGRFIVGQGDLNAEQKNLITGRPVKLKEHYMVLVEVADGYMKNRGFSVDPTYEDARRWLKALGFEWNRSRKIRIEGQQKYPWYCPCDELKRRLREFEAEQEENQGNVSKN